MKLLSTVALATLLLTAATANAFEVKAYTGAPGKASLEDLSPYPRRPWQQGQHLLRRAVLLRHPR